MPSNKNALTRFMFLDEMLSNRHHLYDIHDLTNKCNERLVEAGFPEVSQRCIEKDINYLECAPFYAEIERFRVDGKHCIRYSIPSFSIFKKELSEEESNLILEVLNTIGQFDGLSHFEWLQKLKESLGAKERSKIISFTNNPYLQNSNLLGILFANISHQVTIKIDYQSFRSKQYNNIIVYPYLLKQYNSRWYLICATDNNKKILNLALDRITNVTPIPEKEYIPCEIDLIERFEDIVGITLYEDKPIEHIVFWISDVSKDYITTKPIHGSQKSIKGENEILLRKKHPQFCSGSFFSIDCIPNYELFREICAFGKELIVISPTHIQDEIFIRVQSMFEAYHNLRT